MAEHEHDEFIESIASELRRPVRFDASFDAKVMAALEPAVIPLRKTPAMRPWLLRPRTFSLTPLSGLAAAAAIVGIAALALLRPVAPSEQLAVSTPPQVPVVPVGYDANAPQAVSFVLTEYPNAKSVTVVGDFNDWQEGATKLEFKNGAWAATLPLSQGRHEYQFVVDGKWVLDPSRQAVASDFGGENSVITVRGGQVR